VWIGSIYPPRRKGGKGRANAAGLRSTAHGPIASFLLLVDRIHSNKPRDAGRTISWAVREYLTAQ
jgi:hypothetical protein